MHVFPKGCVRAARGRRALALLPLLATLGSCDSTTAVQDSDFSIATGRNGGDVSLCASHTASFCSGANALSIPIVVNRTNYDGDITLSVSPALGSVWYLVISMQPVIPGPNNHQFEPNGWDGQGYVPDQGTLSVHAFTFGATYADSIFGTKTFVITGTGPDGKVRTTSVSFNLLR